MLPSRSEIGDHFFQTGLRRSCTLRYAEDETPMVAMPARRRDARWGAALNRRKIVDMPCHGLEQPITMK